MTAPFQFPDDSGEPREPLRPRLVHAENPMNAHLRTIRSNAEQDALASGLVLPDRDTIEKLREAAEAFIDGLYRNPFDPTRNLEDRLVEAQCDAAREEVLSAKNAVPMVLAIAAKARSEVPAMPTEKPEVSVVLMAASIAATGIEIGFSLHPQLVKMTEDGPTALAGAILVGVVFGIVVSLTALGVGGAE